MWSSPQTASLFKLKFYFFCSSFFLSALFTQWHFNSLEKKSGWLTTSMKSYNLHSKSCLPGPPGHLCVDSMQTLIRGPRLCGIYPGCFRGSRSPRWAWAFSRLEPLWPSGRRRPQALRTALPLSPNVFALFTVWSKHGSVPPFHTSHSLVKGKHSLWQIRLICLILHFPSIYFHRSSALIHHVTSTTVNDKIWFDYQGS